ncbi:MAG: iron-containing alcohol dehydrogenase, partial [Spirochaetota bacterium]
GENSVERVGELARELGGRNVLLVTDPGVVAAGHAARVQLSLAAAGFAVTVYDRSRENPTTKDVDECLAMARTAQVDLIVAIGGGSSMDTAKGANFLLTNGGRMHDYQGIGKATRPMLPFIAIPTTAGTGSECQSFALIADERTHQKMACGDPKAAARVAILGYRAHGFFNLGVYDPNVYKALGILIDHYELDDVWNMKVEDQAVAARRTRLLEVFDVKGISEAQLGKVAELSAKLEAFLDAKGINALAIRCWPEFAAGYGISPCAAMSLLQSEDRILACEGDLEGALSMLAHRAIGAETPFLFDFSQVNFEQNYALFWHCGVAPCNLWDGRCVRSLDTYFAGGKGVTADFVLKSGELSIFRLDSAGTEYRMFIQKAKAIPMEKELRGTYLKATFDEPVKTVLNKVIDNGFAHHASVVYGDFMKPFRALARITGWKVVE